MRILIAEDEVMSRRLLEATLVRFGHEVVAVADGNAAVDELLGADGPRLAILDWMMPERDGLAVCRTVREQGERYVYVILLSARNGSQDLIAGLDAGADDFLTKPFNAGELRARLRAGLRVLDLQAGLLDAQETLRRHATVDHLTGLWNRRMILEQLDREMLRVNRERRPVSAVMVDIDRFKTINDTHGHAAGDAVIRDVGAAIRSQLREHDFVGRYGGEEFLLILPGCDLESAAGVAERVRLSIEAMRVFYGSLTMDVTVSLGVSSTVLAGQSATVLIADADAALFKAKDRGRNRVEIAPVLIEAQVRSA